MFAANLAQFADQVLVLDPETTIATLIPSSSWLSINSKDLRSNDSAKSEVLSSDMPVGDRRRRTQDKVNNKDEKIKHQVGDAAVWHYYLKSIGLLHSLLLLLFTFIAIFAANFPRMCEFLQVFIIN
jgi:hypothetical protein